MRLDDYSFFSRVAPYNCFLQWFCLYLMKKEVLVITKLTWYGHAALGLDTDGQKIVVDPFLDGNPVASIKSGAVDASFILISHGHGDHVGDSVSIAQRTNALVISVNEIAGWFSNQGLNSHGQHIGGGYKYPFGYLK